MNNKVKSLISSTAISGVLLTSTLVATGNVFAKTDKITICHATGSTTNPYVRIVVSDNADGGHFNTNGTPRSGHLNDILFQGEVDCPSPVISGPINPTPTPTPAPSAPVSAPVSPTPTPTATPTPTPSNGTGGTIDSAASSTSAANPDGQVAGESKVMGASALAETGTTEELMKLFFILGIILIVIAARSHAQKKTSKTK